MKQSEKIYSYARNTLNKQTFEKVIDPLTKALTLETESKYKSRVEQILKLYSNKIEAKIKKNRKSFSDGQEYVAIASIDEAVKEAMDEIKIEMMGL